MFTAIATADWHIKKVPGVPWSWQEARYKRFIRDIILDCLEKRAILIIAGDLLDNASPCKEELQIIFHLLHELEDNNITTLLASGNHETIKSGCNILDYLKVNKFSNIVYKKRYTIDNTTFYLANHDQIKFYKPTLKYNTVNVLVSHFRCNVNKFITEEIDVKAFCNPYDLCVVGDLHHGPEFDNVYYTGNPLNKEFEEDPVNSYLEIVFEAPSKPYEIKRIKTNYPRLLSRKVKANELGSLSLTSEDFYRIEVEGTSEELKSLPKLPDNVILNKIPILENVLAVPEVDEIVNVEGNVDDDMVAYMKTLTYQDDLIKNLMDELRREA